jgi:lipoate-protein ligase A
MTLQHKAWGGSLAETIENGLTADEWSFHKVRIYRFDSFDTGVNLAKEEYLFDYLRPNELVIALYVNSSSVVIGRNQNPWYECPRAASSAETLFYRRLSGGGAVYHDTGNLNFSFMGDAALRSEDVTSVMVDFLRSQGFAAQSGDKGDILLKGKKLSGRASYYRGQRVLHHGTLLVNVDRDMMKNLLAPPTALEFSTKAMPSRRATTTNLREHQPDIDVGQVVDQFIDRMKERWAKHLVVSWEGDPLTQDMVASRLDRHHEWDWRYGRTPFFHCKSMGGQGSEGAEFAVRGGVIETTRFPVLNLEGQRFELPLIQCQQ